MPFFLRNALLKYGIEIEVQNFFFCMIGTSLFLTSQNESPNVMSFDMQADNDDNVIFSSTENKCADDFDELNNFRSFQHDR